MKKVFAFFAVAAALVACKPENLDTTFEVKPALATIEVKCVDVVSGEVKTPTLTSTAGVVSGSTVKITGNPTIAEQDVTITAAYEGKNYSSTVKVDALRANGKGYYTTLILLGDSYAKDFQYELVLREVKKGTSKVFSNFTPYNHAAHVQHSYTHDGHVFDSWARNDSEWMLEASFDYPVSLALNFFTMIPVTKESAEHINIINSYEQAFKTIPWEALGYEGTDVFETKISAYCLYLGYVYRRIDNLLYDLVVTSKKDPSLNAAIATFYVTAKHTSDVNILEIADPEGHGHFVPGHGHVDAHGHGLDNNAGGGIVFAD